MNGTPVTASNIRLRRSFARTKQYTEIPNLIELQKKSYEAFLQKDVDPDRRMNEGIHGVFKSVFPISDFNNMANLEFVSYTLEPPKYDVDECRQRGMSFAAPLKVTLRLIVFDVDEETEARSIRDVKEQEVYLGEIPLMTANGSFIISGTERVVVSQLHRSPGVFFDHDKGKNNTSGKFIYSARVIPYRGSWLDFEFDQKDLIYVRIDRRRKFPVTILLKALGYSTEELLKFFYNIDLVRVGKDGKLMRDLDIDLHAGQRAITDIDDPKTGENIVKAGRRITRAVVKRVKDSGIKQLEVKDTDLEGKVLAAPIIDESTGEIIADVNTEVNSDVIKEATAAGIREFQLIFFDGLSVGPYLRNTLLIDKVATKEESLLEIYKRLRPGEPPTEEAATVFFQRLFFDPETYDLSEVGRLKINHRFNIPFEECPVSHRTLTQKDILMVVKTLIDLKNGQGKTDDIDHLGNRRVRSVGELLENQYRIGLVRMERAIRERMSLQDVETMMPHDLINAKPVNAVVKEFFGSSQLSQFMDQTNPLSEITHKRRLSALGPGGLTRDRAGFEVRDVHPTHYGRICPIETPEGPNIGLIASLATYARINNYGFIETPYRKVVEGKVGKDITYMSALEEQGHSIAQAGRGVKDDKIQADNVNIRKDGEYEVIDKNAVTLMDVSPSQLVSIAASLIPFLEHDDANRALMGSNMQRQAVPVLRPRAPLVGTGVERLVARDSGTSVVCSNDGTVEQVDAERIVIRRFGKGGSLGANVDIYNLTKYQRTNQNTCFNQRPIVHVGESVKKGDIIADGPSTELGELALGQNVLVAFTPWMGYNYEDSILISERMIKDDVYTSVHIEEFECVARDTKLGKEEITRDIANVGEEALADIDSSGVIRIGAEVGPGDILVGKVTPKGETQLSPEEKLLRAIFGEKAGDVRDTSLRVPSGVYGTVIDAQVYSRDGAQKDERLQSIIQGKREKLEKDMNVEQNVIKNNAIDKLKDILVGKKTTGVLLSEDGSTKLLQKDQNITGEDLETIPFELLSYVPLESELEFQVTRIVDAARNSLDAVKMVFSEKIDRLSKGDDLPPGVIKMVKIYVAIKRKLQVGDKFAGRHGNKGVISRVMPVEDMPYLADGTPVDMVLNPLGVPSRMNIGQVLEIHLGWAALEIGNQLREMLDKFNATEARKAITAAYNDPEITDIVKNSDDHSVKRMLEKLKNGIHLATPVFDGALETDVKDLLKRAELPLSGQTVLFDGRTGEPFQNSITVGIMYMLKLHHLVEEKIHARSIGPYSLVSQQPLGGKAQFGGQRLGEMEVWAIEAYGAAYSLQEFLTVKSDDVAGRTRMYESIVKGENVLEPGLPESFNVLVKELQSLALNIELIESDILTERPTDEQPPVAQ
jgi:DNA-directed RNA polymerase subunit beta